MTEQEARIIAHARELAREWFDSGYTAEMRGDQAYALRCRQIATVLEQFARDIEQRAAV